MNVFIISLNIWVLTRYCENISKCIIVYRTTFANYQGIICQIAYLNRVLITGIGFSIVQVRLSSWSYLSCSMRQYWIQSGYKINYLWANEMKVVLTVQIIKILYVYVHRSILIKQVVHFTRYYDYFFFNVIDTTDTGSIPFFNLYHIVCLS